MYQDEEMLPPQSMPWWDPGYLANSEVSRTKSILIELSKYRK